ncbi:unnamed protein product [Durusdinium trenchii]|uniref:Uncharacterized protein n=2 Tax=Durusdinium trenchii TaxID=1381693 RepID=A0ABP0LEI2_9DINO
MANNPGELTVNREDFEEPGRPKQSGDFKVQRLVGVWKAEHILCRRCGQIFNYGTITGPVLKCSNCSFEQPFDEKKPISSVATVYERVKPPWWSTSAEQGDWAQMEEEVTEHPEIDQECPSCGHNRLQFWTRQLRSADEGLSVFFLCKKCGWRTVEK